MRAIDKHARMYLYQDDLVLVGQPAALRIGYDMLQRRLSALGLTFNTTKSSIWGPDIASEEIAAISAALGLPKADSPVIFHLRAIDEGKDGPTPVSLPDVSSGTSLSEDDPQLQQLFEKRKAFAANLRRMHSSGLEAQICKALLRDACGSDVTWLMRTV